MKMKENKSFFAAFLICTVLTAVGCTFVFKLVGQTNLVGACVGMLIPSDSSSETAKKISVAAKKAFTNADGQSKDKNDGESSSEINSLAYVPDDIKALTEKAEKTFDAAEKGGKIVSQTYGEESATQRLESILVKNTTGRELNISDVLKSKPSLEKSEKNDISVLIFHTHTTECYQIVESEKYLKSFSPRDNDKGHNMVRIGDEITSQLEKAGIGVIHDTKIYDSKYSGAYERSGEGVDSYLEKYPTIQVVIDVHRDAIQTSESTKVKPVTTINGKKAAQIMTITGCEGGEITDFPNWEKNLCFALHLQKTAEEMYPTLMRPVFFCNRKYNMYKSDCSVLLEIGSDANTLDEAAYSGRLIGNVLAVMLKKYL